MKLTPLMLATALLAAIPLFSACAAEAAATEGMTPKEPEAQTIAMTLLADMEQTGLTDDVPAEYLTPTAHQGTVERLDYATKDYAGGGADIQKTAYVYLPYGYNATDAKIRNAIVYLMHGWGGSAGEYFNL